MISATPPAASPGPYPARRLPFRRTVLAATLAGCCATVGCQGSGGPLALLKRGGATPEARVVDDPFNAAEAALASAAPSGAGDEGRVSLGGGAVRTAALDGARTAARPAGGVTRVDPSTPPRTAPGRWKAGEGSDSEVGAAKVTLTGGAFAASDAPAPAARVTPAAAQRPAARSKTAATAPAAAPTAAPKTAAAAPPQEDVDWGAEMAAFAEQAAETPEESPKSPAESATPADAPATPDPTVPKESESVTKPAATVTENLSDPVDRESLSHAPLWNAAADEPATEPGAPAAAAPAPKAAAAAAPASQKTEDDGWRSRSEKESKAEPATEIDPFAGL
ncbi:hypothetical protein [Alienimonas sp. DA493]|uniref:hypothetical protein n=1 Tax=Alienimonas sp. DA493 TaxID=3373605 RepID=UPI003754867E